jgi:hypothetical protein
MKVEEYDGGRERRVLAGLVMNSSVCGKLAALPQRDFASPAAKTIADLCVGYYQKHGKAPRKNIVGLVAAWAEGGQDKETVRNIERLINYAVEEGSGLNSGYLVDEASILFNQNRVRTAITKAQGFLALGKTNEALAALQVNPVQAGVSTFSWPLNDPEEALLAFAEDELESLVRYKDGLGQFFGTDVGRGSFIAFMAPEGVGKSQWLLDVAFRAVMQRRKVAYFQVGDMTRRQVDRRIYSRIARHPFQSTIAKSNTAQWPCQVKYPSKLTPEGEMDWEHLAFDSPLVGPLAQQAQIKWAKKVGTDRRLFNLSCHHNQSITVYQLKGALRQLAREEDFVPEMVVVDYADNLMSSSEKLSPRDQHALNWDVLRSIAMENNCAVVTATQVNRPGYEVKVLQMKHISEEKRKIAHVTMLVGINQQPHEKQQGLYRLNCIKNRNNDFSVFRCCYVLSCLPLANPAVLSVFPFKGFDLKPGDEE